MSSSVTTSPESACMSVHGPVRPEMICSGAAYARARNAVARAGVTVSPGARQPESSIGLR